MELPNWFRIAWWVAIFATVTWYLHHRYPELIAGNETVSDVIVFLVWICLGLLPIVNEVNLFGVHLKKKIDEVEKNLSTQISSLRLELQNTVAISSNVNPHVTVNMPQPDSQIPQIEQMVRQVLEREMQNRGISGESEDVEVIELPENVGYLVSVRMRLEQEIRRIFLRTFPEQNRYTSVTAMTRVLANREIITHQLANAILEVYRACSGAVHGEEVTQSQLSFVQDVALEMITTLRAI